MNSILQCSHITKKFGSLTALDDVNFTIENGEYTAIMGESGSGKTTLLRAVAGLLSHTGCCLMDGVPLESLSTRCLAQTVSYIPQQSGISVSMSAREVATPALACCKAPPLPCVRQRKKPCAR